MIDHTNKSALFLPSGCLTPSALESLASGNLREEELHSCQEHLEHCALCSDSLAGLRSWLTSHPPATPVAEIQMEIVDHKRAKRQLVPHSKKHFSEKISGINKRVQNRVEVHKETQNKRTELSFPSPYRWLSLAASIVLFFGVYYLVRMKPPDKETALAKQTVTVTDQQAYQDTGRSAVATPQRVTSSEKESSSPAPGEPAVASVEMDSDIIEDDNIMEYQAVDEVQEVVSLEYKAPPAPDVPAAANESLAVSGISQKSKRSVVLTPAREENSEIFSVVEEPPVFPGGAESMNRFILENIRYPETAKESGMEGVVHIRFIVDTNGVIRNARVVRGISRDFDEEALRMINNMPSWVPGKQGGKPVASEMEIPVRFKIGR